VWRRGDVKFVPPLKAKTKLVRQIGWGPALRVTLRFDGDFWRGPLVPPQLKKRGRPAFGFLVSLSERFTTWWAPAATEPLIVGWAGGPDAEALQSLSEAQIKQRALR